MGALRTPCPWALGTQYLRIAMVLLDGRPAIAMHVSRFFGLRFFVALPVSPVDAMISLSPPQMGLW